ncbi:MAG: metalloregulator ArsR/SmtB family transcription factor [Planctomycetota bacterium]|nr:metalloregulator ArsR/SmtB family transcription factor [Planctomycetota bacterium]
MAATALTTAEIFRAIAEPRRREIIDILVEQNDLPVGDLVQRLRLPQPAVSKHLSVLRKVGLVVVTKQGQQRLYRLNPQQLKPVHDWIKTFEQYWTRSLERIKLRAERAALERKNATPKPSRNQSS